MQQKRYPTIHEKYMEANGAFWQGVDSNWRNYNKARMLYSTKLHLAASYFIQSAIDDIVQHADITQQEKGEFTLTIADIAGGNGDLAERIIKGTQARHPKLRIV